MTKPLSGKVAVVAGATRGAGRGIAVALGEAGATVYCTGRSVAGSPRMKGRPETIHETADLVTARGGQGIAVRVDHTVPAEVALAADPNVTKKNGRVVASWDLGDEYGVTDADGSRPHFVRWLKEHMPEVAAGWKKADDGIYSYWHATPA